MALASVILLPSSQCTTYSTHTFLLFNMLNIMSTITISSITAISLQDSNKNKEKTSPPSQTNANNFYYYYYQYCCYYKFFKRIQRQRQRENANKDKTRPAPSQRRDDEDDLVHLALYLSLQEETKNLEPQPPPFILQKPTTKHSQKVKPFPWTDVNAACNNFDKSLLLGEGAFGPVFRGRIGGAPRHSR